MPFFPVSKRIKLTSLCMRNFVKLEIKSKGTSNWPTGNISRKKVEQNKGDSGKLWGHLKSLGYAKMRGGSSKIVLD